MRPKSKTPAGKAGASRVQLGGCSQIPLTFMRPAAQLPHLIALHLGAEALAMLAIAGGAHV